MKNRFRVDVFTVSGLMIQLDEEFETASEADRRASVIALQGLRVCITSAVTTYIPAHMLSSVSIYDKLEEYKLNAAVFEISKMSDKQLSLYDPRPESN